MVGELVCRQPPEDLEARASSGNRVGTPPRREGGVLVIEIVDLLRIAVADEDVLAAVVVEVREERAPAPVGVRDAREAPDLAEDDISGRTDAVAELERIERVIEAEAPTLGVEHATVRLVSAHPLSSSELL